MTAAETADREKRRVALSSVIAAVFLTTTKIVVGLWTGSLGILSEAAHSGLDLVAAVVTLFAVRVSGKPADVEHTYGHGKIESLSALFETFLLLVTCVWIVYEAVERLFFRPVHVDVNVWSFLVILVSIVVDISRSRALGRAARKYRSQALEADALHFSTDIWSSAVVLFGLIMVYFSDALGVPWLVKADAVAALTVAGIVVWISIRLGKKTIDDLLDAVPSGMVEQVVRAAHVSGVSEIKRARVRRSGPGFFADVTIAVNRDLPFSFAHRVAHRTEESIRRVLPEADIVVHVDPFGKDHDSLVGTIRAIAGRHGLFAHAIATSAEDDSGSIEMHVEVDPSLRVAEAHDRVTAFETELRREIPFFSKVTTHIEPVGAEPRPETPAAAALERKVLELLTQLIREGKMEVHIHDLEIRNENGTLAVLFHCGCDGKVKVGQAHDLTARMETRLHEELPQVGRVVIHIEPIEHSDH